MSSTTRRTFASRIACLFTAIGAVSLIGDSASAATKSGAVQKLDYEGKPAAATALFTPVIVHNEVLYISGQGAHSREPNASIPAEIGTHTSRVMDSVKTLVEAGGGTMDILQLNVFLANIGDYAGMNTLTKPIFPTEAPLELRLP